jgi:hypothetical protein
MDCRRGGAQVPRTRSVSIGPTERLLCRDDKDLRTVWGSGSSDAWVGGGSGALLHWDGSAWTPHPSVTRTALYSIWGTGGPDVRAVGQLGTILHHRIER